MLVSGGKGPGRNADTYSHLNREELHVIFGKFEEFSGFISGTRIKIIHSA